MKFDPKKEMEYILRYMEKEIIKILCVDLLHDSFEVIKADEHEFNETNIYSDRISVWLKNFAQNGHIHPDDVSGYLAKTDINFIRSYFLAGHRKLTVSYRRMSGLYYKWVSMRMIASVDYSAENQVIMLFVQEDDSAESLDLIQTAKQQFAIMKSLAKIYVTLHVIDFKNDSSYDLSNAGNNSVTFEAVPNATERMRSIMRHRITPEYLDQALTFSDLTTLRDRMRGKPAISCDLLGKNVGWIRAQFIAIDTDSDQRPTHVVFATSAIDDEKRREEALLRLSTELNLATAIQSNVIPNTFPAFPQKNEFDLYASMKPAKEVGGDFYDFFELNDGKIGIVIADASGKGIPAALFMMVSKVLLKTQAQKDDSPAKVLEIVNQQLCENNRAEMFVTVWLGILDPKTGIITAANAGHEYPALKKANGQFELLKDPHGLVIGGMNDIKYHDYQIQLEKGDMLFVYTDGVTEAINANEEAFGTDRMLNTLNRISDPSCQQLLRAVHEDINDFVQNAPQFDDITMLALEYFGTN